MPDCASCGQPCKPRAHKWCGTCIARWYYHDRPGTGPPPAGPGARFADYLDIRSWDLRTAPSFAQFAARAAVRLDVTVRTIWRYEHRARELEPAS